MTGIGPELRALYALLEDRLDDVGWTIAQRVMDDLLRAGGVVLSAASNDITVSDDGTIEHMPEDPYETGAAIQESEIIMALPRALEVIHDLTGRTAQVVTTLGADLGGGPQIGGAVWTIHLVDYGETGA